MRVLMVAQPTEGGVAQHVEQLSAHARAAGLDVAVACPDGMLADAVVARGIRRVPVELVREPGLGDLRAVARLRPLVASADVVHLHSAKAGAVGRLALTSLGRRRPAGVFTPHAWSWMVGGPMAPVYRGVERVLAPAADVIIAVGEDERRAGAAVLGRAADRVTVIPNGVDTDRFAPDGPVAARGDDPLVVCVGRLSRQKGLDVAITALPSLPTVRLRLVGEGPDAATLRALARDLGVADRLELVGWDRDVVRHYRAADVVLVPSRWDGLSLSLLEALSTGRPVVATTAAGAVDLGDVAVLVPPEDAATLGAAVRDLLADPDRRHALGDAARDRVRRDHDLHASLDATLAVYRRVAARGHARGR